MRLQNLGRFTEPESVPLWLRLSWDTVALMGIAGFALSYAGFLLRNDLFLYGDHPGQFYRLWQLLGVIWPEEGRLIGWSPYWYAGYPELQFYPPGFALAGWLIWMASFQQLPLFVVYQILVFASFVLPAIGFYLLLAWGLGDRLAGLAAAWLALTAPLPLGGVQGTMIGMVGERLAFGFMPLLVLTGLWLIRTERKLWPVLLTGLILAAILLLHPYQAILPVGILGLYTLFLGAGRFRRLQWLAVTVLLGFGLTVFWWFPLGWRRRFFIPLIEAPLQEIQTNLEALLWFEGMGWLLLMAVVGLFLRPAVYRWLTAAIFLGGLSLLGFIFFDYHVLVEQLNFYALDPVRLIAGVTFTLFIALAVGLSNLAWMGTRLLQQANWGIAGLPLVLFIPGLIYADITADYDFAKWISKWQPASQQTPIFWREAAARYDFPTALKMMAATPGRILFTSHYSLLFDVPTSLKGLTPYFIQREILGGTFTHRTPVGSYLWLGQARPPVLRGKVERQDDKTLAGVAWENMQDDFFFDLVRRFNATLIVTTATDAHAHAFLDSSSRFSKVWSNRLFTFYQPVGYHPTWAEASQATATVRRYERTAIDIDILEARPEATLSIKVANYELWQAEINDQTLPIQTDAYGLMHLFLPPGSYTVQLRYEPGWPEWLGDALSGTTLVIALGNLIWGLLRPPASQ
ncbi:MAG: hypothetical protein L6R45_15635 [Anaerolineae bacterium]|nr:hypothetical protein [Anaerolineae bacterium]